MNPKYVDIILSALKEAGYNRASMVYDMYLEYKKEYTVEDLDEDFNLEDLTKTFLYRFLPDGRPKPQSMIELDWPDNLNQIFCDNFDEVELDNEIIQGVDPAKVINEYLTFEQQWNAVEDGAKKFISDTYGEKYL